MVLSADSLFSRLEPFLLTLWIGGLWTVGYLVAPILFSVLDDRALAGMIAGRLFGVMSYLGLVCGGLLGLGLVLRSPLSRVATIHLAILGVMLILILIGEFVLQPQMAALKAAGIESGSANAAAFGRMHGVASIIYLVESLLGLALVVRGYRRDGLRAV